MNVSRWITACGLAFLWSIAPSYSQMLGPSDSAGVQLNVDITWGTHIDPYDTNNSPQWISASIILFPDHITVSKYGQTPEAEDINRGCKLDMGPNGKTLLSASNAQKIIHCTTRGVGANITATQHAVMLPIAAGPRKCTETGLANGTYRICAALLQQSQNTLRMEYEEDLDRDGKVTASRARFDIVLLRNPGTPLRRIEGCTVKALAAFTFNPREPSKLAPSDQVTNDRCSVTFRN
jgi:hypothetical protein